MASRWPAGFGCSSTSSHRWQRRRLRRQRSQKKNLIGLIMPDIGYPFAGEVMKGVNRAIAESDFDLLVYTTGDVRKSGRASHEQKYVALLSNSITDGVIVVSLPPPEEDAPRLERSGVPVVFIDAREHTTGLPRVLGDDIAGGELATRHHRRIGFVGDAFVNPFGFTSSRDRFDGYRKALDGAEIEAADGYVALGAHGRYEARDLAAQMLSRPVRPTAIFAASDTQALGVLAAAQDLGLHVPDDLSVIGYDDIEACDFVGLTTVRQHLFESGRQGADLLMAEIVRRAPVPPTVVIEPDIVRRRSTGPRKEDRG